MELKLKSGERVVDRYRSHLHGEVARLLPDALSRIESQGRKFFIDEIDFGRLIGETVCVPTGPSDQIVYAKRPKRFGHSRFVANRKPEPCSALTLILMKAENEQDTYVLITAFVGHRPEPEPWDRNANANSRAFWSSRALVWGSEEVIPGTETAVCPWD